MTRHLIFDVKMDFTRKASFFLDGHKTPDPIGSTYAGVVSHESIRIDFTYAALNGIDVSVSLYVGLATEVPKLTHYWVV